MKNFSDKEKEFFKKFGRNDSRSFSRYDPPSYKEFPRYNIYFRLTFNILIIIFNILFILCFTVITIIYIAIAFIALYILVTGYDKDYVKFMLVLFGPMLYLFPLIEGLRTGNCPLHYKTYNKESDPIGYKVALFGNFFTYVALIIFYIWMITGH